MPTGSPHPSCIRRGQPAWTPKRRKRFCVTQGRTAILSSSPLPERYSSSPHCTGSLAAFVQFPSAQAVYSDLDIEGSDGSVWPLAFSAFDYERMLEQGYCGHLFALRRPAAEQALAAGASDVYRVFNSVLDDGSISHSDVVHIPGSLGTLPDFDRASASAVLAAATAAHLECCGTEAEVTPKSGRYPSRSTNHAKA